MANNLVSLDECLKIIHKLIGNENFKLIDFNVSSYCEGYPGFLGDYFLLKIKFSDHSESIREERFFVKSLPVTNIKKRDVIEEYGIFRKEARLFKYLVPNLLKYSGTKWAPTCYLSRDDLLVFEDLKVASYQTLPRHIDPSTAHIKMALRSLAAFHAANIVYERVELKPKGSLIGEAHADVLFETSYGTDVPWCMTGVRALKAVALHCTKYGFGSSYENDIQEKFVEKVSEVFKFHEPNASIPLVCCHRDLWKNNLMYRFDGGDLNKPLDCLLIDYQICRYLPLTLDVVICVLLSSRNHSNFDECLEFYYKQLEEELLLQNVKLEGVMSRQDYEDSCRRFRLFPLVQQGMFWSLSHLPSEFLTDLLNNNESEYIKMCEVQRDEIVLEFMAKDEFYKETMTETVERLVEYLFVDENNLKDDLWQMLRW